MFVIVVSNVFYDISAKSFPTNMNAQIGLVVVYFIGTVCSLAMFFITSKEKSIIKEFKKGNKMIVLLSAGSLGIDLGYVLLFRAGWDIGVGSLVCNILLATALLIIGVICYKEKLLPAHIVGIIACLGGLILINMQGDVKFGFFLPVLLVVGANVLYDVSAKSVPDDVNTFFSLAMMHILLMGVNLVWFFLRSGGDLFIEEVLETNWAVILFAFTMIGLDAGYILLYRAGWNISLGTLVCNIALSVAMITIGITIYNESFVWYQLVGVGACLIGLVSISYTEIKERN